MEQVITASAAYSKISALVDKCLEPHLGDRFTLDELCKWIGAVSPDARKDAATKLGFMVKQGILEKKGTHNGAVYHYPDKTVQYVDWMSASGGAVVPFNWPLSHIDGTSFDFDGNLVIREKSLIVIAGGSNTGKTATCMNIAAENIAQWSGRMCIHKSEFTPDVFRDQIYRMGWADFSDENGNSRFALVNMATGFNLYAVDPDALNIIDWLGLDGNFWEIREIMKSIQGRLNKGVAVVAMQKKPSSDRAEGGVFTEHFSSVYLAMDYGVMRVVKAKEPINGYSAQGKMYGFKISNGGSEFSNIREIKPCTNKHCKRDETCKTCSGTGYVDKNTFYSVPVNSGNGNGNGAARYDEQSISKAEWEKSKNYASLF